MGKDLGKTLGTSLLLVSFLISACFPVENPRGETTKATSTNSYRWSTATPAPTIPETATPTRQAMDGNTAISNCGINAALQSCPSSIVTWLTNRLRLRQINQIGNLVGANGASFVKANTDFFLPFENRELFSQALQDNLNISSFECLGFTTNGEVNGFLEIYYTGLTLDYFKNGWETDILLFGFAYEDGKYNLVGVGPMLTSIYESTFVKNPLSACPE